MKQKNVRYFLITGVAVIWGIVIYKVVAALNQQPIITKSSPSKFTAPEPVEKNDSFFLYANYPDPFIPDTGTVAIVQNNNITAPDNRSNDAVPYTAPVKAANVKIDMSFINYHGMIANPSNKSRAALLSISNREFMLKENEQVENILLKQIYADHIRLLYNHKMYTIFKLN